MVVVSIEEVIEMNRRLEEIDSTPFKDILFVGKGGMKIGCVVVKLDEEKARDWSILGLITSGAWKDCVIP
jgi:hypothetical protein